MCPPGYHHNGIMAARELGHTMYGYIYIYIYTESEHLRDDFTFEWQKPHSKRQEKPMISAGGKTLPPVFLDIFHS